MENNFKFNDISLNFIKSKNNQIFKYIVPKNIFLTFLNKIKKYNNNNKIIFKNKIIIDKFIYKKLLFNKNIEIFINKIRPYYFKKKIILY